MPLTFAPNSVNGEEMCAPVTANADNEVECEEDFSVKLDLFTPGNNLNLANDVTEITIVDTNGIEYYN